MNSSGVLSGELISYIRRQYKSENNTSSMKNKIRGDAFNICEAPCNAHKYTNDYTNVYHKHMSTPFSCATPISQTSGLYPLAAKEFMASVTSSLCPRGGSCSAARKLTTPFC